MKKLLRLAGIIFSGILYLHPVKAQETDYNKPMAADLAIPVAPAYQLLDASATLISKPSVTRDFKVDWSLKSYRLAPNLALEVQPVWLALYNNKNNLARYRKAGYIPRTLSTLSFSAGTLDGNDTTRFFAYAGKITLFRSHDPLLDPDLYSDYELNFSAQYYDLQSQLTAMKLQRKDSAYRMQKDSLDKKILEKENEIFMHKKNYREKIKQKQEEYRDLHWNDSHIEIAYGKTFSFNPRLTDNVDSLKLDNTGQAVWINASVGIARHWLISGLLRSVHKTGFVRTTVLDSLTQISVTDARKKSLMDYAAGINIRYGSSRYSFFIEGFYSISSTVKPVFTDLIDTGNDIIEDSEKFTLGYGGDLKLGNNVLLSYGIRTVIDESVRFRGMLPIAGVTCLMK